MDISPKNEIDFIKILATLLKGKYIILGTSIFCLIVGFLKYKMQKPYFEVASLVIKKTTGNTFGASSNAMNLLGGGGVNNFTDDLKSTFTSNMILSHVVDTLNLKINYLKKGFFYDTELYKDCPFVVVFDENSPQPIDFPFKIKLLENNTFRISADSFEEIMLFDYKNKKYIYKKKDFEGIEKVLHFGAPLKTDFFSFKILQRNPNQKIKKPFQYFFTFTDKTTLIRNIKYSIDIQNDGKESKDNLIISIKTDHIQRGIAILNRCIFFLQKYEVDAKNIESNYSIDFINKKINDVVDTLNFLENKQILYRQNKKILSVDSKSYEIINRLQSIDEQKINYENKKSYINYLKEYVSKNMGKDKMLAPSFFGIDDAMILGAYNSLNALNLSLIDNKFAASETTPYRYEIQRRIDQYQQKFLHSIEERQKSNKIWLKQINKEKNRWENELKKLPNYKRNLLTIQRRISFFLQRYNLLISKRENLQIIKANNLPDTKIIDPPYLLGMAKKRGLKFYLAVGLAAGIFLGVFVVLGIDFIKYLRKELRELKDA